MKALLAMLSAAEAQLAAARTADAAGLLAANAARVEAQAAIDVDALRADPSLRAEAVAVARRVRALDLRTQACGQTVLAAIGALDRESAPSTYGRRGLVRGA